MTIELFFAAGSFVVGVSQVVEAWILLREGGRLRGAMAATSALEFSWLIFCIYLLVAGRLESAQWLAILFIALSAAAIVCIVVTDPHGYKKPPEEVRVPTITAYIGGLFGAAYAIAALVFLAI